MGFSFTYNGVTCALGTAKIPAGPFAYTVTGDTFSFACDVLVTAETAAELASECAALEAAFSVWDTALSAAVDGVVVISHSPSAASGFQIRPTLKKAGSADDSERSRRYAFRVDGRLPASRAGGAAGFVEETIAVAVDAASRATVTFSGRYTADAMASARANCDHVTTGAAARAAAWLAVFDATGDYELIRAETDETAGGNVIDYRRAYRQRLAPETAAGAGSADFSIESLTLTRDVSGDAGANTATAVMFSVAFSAVVNAAAVDYAGMHALYLGTIKPALQAHLNAVWMAVGDVPSTGQTIISRERVRIDTANSRIAVEWDVMAPTGAVMAVRVRRELAFESRVEPRKIWDGRPHTFLLLCPGSVWRATVTVSAETVGAPMAVQPSDFLPSKPAGAEAAKWVLMASKVASEADHAGTGQSADVVYRTAHTFEFLLVEPPSGGMAAAVIAPAPAIVD